MAGLSSLFSGFSGSVIGNIASAFITAYTSREAYKSQRDASELQSEAAQQQVKAAGFQQQMAAKQEMAAMEAKRLSELNAIDSEIQTARQVENQRMEQRQSESEARARAAASGVTLTGSTGNYLNEQQRVNSEQLGWMRKAGQRKAEELRSQGSTTYQTAMAGAQGTRAGAAQTMAGARGTEAQSKQSMAGAYNSINSGASSLFNIGTRAKWF